MTDKKYPYSVLMGVYHKDKPEYLRVSIDSMLNQTIPPEEVLLAVDGPIGDELRSVIEGYKERYGELFTVCYFDTNRGIGAVMRDTLPLCRNEFIARMDADDYSVPERIEKEFAIFEKYPDLCGVGSNVSEFEDDMAHPVSHVVLPEKPEDVLKFARRRCPFRQSTFLTKKSAVLAAGNYGDFRRGQDYELIARMLMTNMHDGKGGIYNIQEELTYMRISRDYYKRRGGWNILTFTLGLRWELLRMGFISVWDFVVGGFAQSVIALMPGRFIEWFYKRFLRS